MFHPYFLMGVSLNPFLTLPYQASANATVISSSPVARVVASTLPVTSIKQTQTTTTESKVTRPNTRRQKSLRRTGDVTSTTSDSSLLVSLLPVILGSNTSPQQPLPLPFPLMADNSELKNIQQGQSLEAIPNGSSVSVHTKTLSYNAACAAGVIQSAKVALKEPLSRKNYKKSSRSRHFAYDAFGAMDLSAQK